MSWTPIRHRGAVMTLLCQFVPSVFSAASHAILSQVSGTWTDGSRSELHLLEWVTELASKHYGKLFPRPPGRGGPAQQFAGRPEFRGETATIRRPLPLPGPRAHLWLDFAPTLWPIMLTTPSKTELHIRRPQLSVCVSLGLTKNCLDSTTSPREPL